MELGSGRRSALGGGKVTDSCPMLLHRLEMGEFVALCSVSGRVCTEGLVQGHVTS